MIDENVTVVRAGVEPARAKAAVVLIHGRGATADGIIGLADDLGVGGVAYVAPQAPAHTWYPQSFLAPLAANEPHLSRALATVDAVVRDLERQGVPAERIVLAGFSQGACLALEYAARNARRWGGVVGFSGGLIGPDGTPRDYAGSLAETPVFLGCSDVDAHIPLDRVHETDDVLRGLGGDVIKRIYPGMGHTIVADEVAYMRAMLSALAADTED
jgi:phospholipase/carboxylesterase